MKNTELFQGTGCVISGMHVHVFISDREPIKLGTVIHKYIMNGTSFFHSLILIRSSLHFSQRLAPLNVPTLSAEELIEKQKLADEKREKVCVGQG